jgi:hypothetical protein
MKRCSAILLAALLLLPACSKEIRTETLKLEENIPFHEGSANNLSLSLDIDFPVSGFSARGLESVRQAIRTYTISDAYADCTGPITELGQIWRNNVADDYLTSNQGMLEEMDIAEEDAPFLNWGFDYKGCFGETYEHFVNYLIEKYEYLGGAHGMSTETPLVFDLETGDIVTHEFFTGQVGADKLKELIDKHKYDNLKDMIQDAGIEEENIFYVESIEPSSFYTVSQEGLTFYYQPYDLAPYVFGVITIPISWDGLK